MESLETAHILGMYECRDEDRGEKEAILCNFVSYSLLQRQLRSIIATWRLWDRTRQMLRLECLLNAIGRHVPTYIRI